MKWYIIKILISRILGEKIASKISVCPIFLFFCFKSSYSLTTKTFYSFPRDFFLFLIIRKFMHRTILVVIDLFQFTRNWFIFTHSPSFYHGIVGNLTSKLVRINWIRFITFLKTRLPNFSPVQEHFFLQNKFLSEAWPSVWCT